LVLCFTGLVEAQEPTRPHPPPPGKSLPSSYLPTRFRIAIGGFFPPSYSVELRGESLLYHARTIDPQTQAVRETSKVITPSAGQWQRFWKATDEVDLWRWQAEYANPLVTDGTSWAVDIVSAGRMIESSGRNAYPGGAASAPKPSQPEPGPPATSKTFDAYLSAVEDLLGGERFR
jgi:hypothetical protein